MAAYQDSTVKLMQEYLRIDTSNPPGNELAAARFYHRLFDEASIPNTIYEYAPGRADFYATLKGDGSLRPFVMLTTWMWCAPTPPAGASRLSRAKS